MIFTREQVWQQVKAIAPKFKLDPYLIMAVNEQECEHNIGPHGKRVFDINQYDAGVPRLEQNFMDRYTRDFEYSTVVEGLLAMSYGTMQMMGESLREAKNADGQNYFEWFLSHQSPEMKARLVDPLSTDCLGRALDYFCVNPDLMIEMGCIWFVTKQAKGGNEHDWLLRWNGGGNQRYDDEVLERIPRLKIQCK